MATPTYYYEEPEPSLETAVLHGDLPLVRRLLDTKEANIEEVGFLGMTPIMVAACNSYGDVVELLIEHNANIFLELSDGITLLHLAAVSPWFHGRGLGKTLKHLIEIAKKDSRIDIDKKANDGNTALDMAVCEGTFEAVEVLLAAGANPRILDKYGRTSLFRVAERVSHGDDAKIKILIQYMTEDDLNMKDIDGNTATHAIVEGGFVSMVVYGEIARRTLMLEMMIKARADMFIKNNDELSPHDLAMKKGRTVLATVLLTETTRIAAVQALCMGIHPRLGSGSRFSDLDQGVVNMIASYL